MNTHGVGRRARIGAIVLVPLLPIAAWLLERIVDLPEALVSARPESPIAWFGLALLGMVAGAGTGSRNRVEARTEADHEGRPHRFVLRHGVESIVVEPGRSWFQLDHFKWVTRGIIEPPQSFVVHPDGSVDLNGENYRPEDAAGAGGLEEQLNKRHLAVGATVPRAPAPASARPAEPASRRVQFRVRLDHLGHLLVSATRGAERTETGLRGLEHLAVDGWMRKPDALHIDPLQRHLELNDLRFEATPDGARRLEEYLNSHCVPPESAESAAAIEVRENPAAATGFDIHFWIVRAGTRFEIKGHLSQDKLDILQDHDKCDLLIPGIILRIAPPYLYVRRRRPDGGEEHLPGLPDVKYRSITAAELRRLLNHPLIRQGGTAADSPDPLPAPMASPGTAPTPAPPAGDAMPTGTAPPHPFSVRAPAEPLEVPAPRRADPTPGVDASSRPRVGSVPMPPRLPSKDEEPGVVRVLSPAEGTPFRETDPRRINEAVFRRLAERLRVPLLDVLFDLPRVFENRRFEILSFGEEEITSVLQLRSGRFYGWYLTHIDPSRIDLVYAARGTHIEWGTHKCAVQPIAGAETHEFRGPALHGLAQDARHHFVFVVDRRFREWVTPHVGACGEAFAHFVTPDEWAAHADDYPLIWPPPD